MKRVVKKTIAAALAATMLLPGLVQNNVMSVQAAENSQKWEVEFRYDDYDLGYWKNSVLFMKDGKFNEEVDENAVLVLVDEDGNMTEIPSSKNGERIFTKSGGSVSGSYYQNNCVEMVKICRDDKIAGLYYDGSYFGGEEKYYTGSDMRWATDYAVCIYTRNLINSTSGSYYQYNNYKMVTDTGKIIEFADGGSFNYMVMEDNLLCYQYDGDIIYTYSSQTDEIGEIAGKYEYISEKYFVVTSKEKNTKEFYDSSMKNIGISFSAESSISASHIGDYLILYQDNSDFFYVYNSKTNEIEKKEGKFESVPGSYFFITSKNAETKELYDSSMKYTGISLPTDIQVKANVLNTGGYMIVSDADGYENIISSDGSYWNSTDKLLTNIKILNEEKGYYCANVKNRGEQILSKDNSINVNIYDITWSNVYEVVDQFKEEQGRDDISCGYTYSDQFLGNGDFVRYIYDIYSGDAQIGKNYLLIFQQAKNYSEVKRFEGDNIYSSSKYVLIGKSGSQNGVTIMTDLVLYDNQYQKKAEVQLPEEVECVYSVSRIDNDEGIFALWCKVKEKTSYSYYLLSEDGKVKKASSVSKLYNTSNKYYSYYMSEGKIEVYNKAGVLIYTGEYEYDPNIYTSSPINSPDGSMCLITLKGNRSSYDSESKYIVIGYDGTVYFDSDDYKLAKSNFLIDKNGNVRLVVYQENNEESKKYGLLFMDKIKKTLISDENISIEFISGQIDKNAVLEVRLLTEADEEYTKIDIANKIIDSNIKPEEVKITPYEITLLNNENQPVQPNGKVTVKIPCPQGYQGEKCKVYYADAKGEFTDMGAVYADGYLSFETTHFSTYFVTETELQSKPETNYGDVNGDGEVNTKDAVLLKKHLAGYEGLGIDMDAADVNADGNVDSKDAVKLLRYLAGYAVTLGE